MHLLWLGTMSTDWTTDRIQQVWLDLRESSKPLDLLDRRLRKAIDAPGLQRHVADGLAELFIFRGFLYVVKHWCADADGRQMGLARACESFMDAEALSVKHRALSLCDLGLCELLIALEPEPDMGLLWTMGQLPFAAPVPHGMSTQQQQVDLLRSSHRHLQARDCTPVQHLLSVVAVLIGGADRSLTVRKRQQWLRMALIDPASDYVYGAAKKEMDRLAKLPLYSRLLGRADMSPFLSSVFPIHLSIDLFQLPKSDSLLAVLDSSVRRA